MVSMREVHKVAVASLIGTSLEFYDFLLYGFVANTFALLFFPSIDPTAALLAVLATFAIGYVARPVGAWLFGHLGDKWGRKKSFVLALSLMATASLLTALLPTYSVIGILAPLFLVILRLLQGLSVGGELGPGITIISEYAPKEHRGFWVAFTQISQFLGPFLATLGVMILSLIMNSTTFVNIGWRILFGIGAVIGVIGGLTQWYITESPLFKKQAVQKVEGKTPVVEYFTKYWRTLLKAIGFSISGTVVIYLIGVFAVVYLENIIKVSTLVATEVVTIGYIGGIIGTVIGGYLSDIYGRRKIIIGALLGDLVFIYPYFMMLSSGNFTLIVLAQVIMTFIFSFGITSIVLLPELFPTRIRATGVALTYNLNTSIFGGTTPYIATALIIATHWILAPIIWGLSALVISLLTMIFLIKETKGIDLEEIK